MSATASFIRTWVVPMAFGVVASYLLIEAWAFSVANVQLTYWLWKQYQIAPRDLPFDVTSLFDAVFGLFFGAVLSYVLIRIVRGSLVRAWLLFAFGFLLPLVAPSIFAMPEAPDLDLIFFVLSIPVIWCFAIASIVVFCLRHRSAPSATLP